MKPILNPNCYKQYAEREMIFQSMLFNEYRALVSLLLSADGISGRDYGLRDKVSFGGLIHGMPFPLIGRKVAYERL